MSKESSKNFVLLVNTDEISRQNLATKIEDHLKLKDSESPYEIYVPLDALMCVTITCTEALIREIETEFRKYLTHHIFERPTNYLAKIKRSK